MPQLLRIAFALAFLFPASTYANDDEPEKHEYLFLLEEAYTQEDNESQLGASLSHSLETSEWDVEAEFEYGLTDRLQISMEMPIEKESSENPEIEELEFGVAYALILEDTSSLPTVTAALSIEAPLSADGNWEYVPSLNTSKQISDDLFLHTNLAGAFVSDDEISGVSEWSTGIGVAWEAVDETWMIAEILYEEEAELDAGRKVWKKTNLASVGFGIEPIDDVMIGSAYAHDLNESDGSRIIIQAQIEW